MLFKGNVEAVLAAADTERTGTLVEAETIRGTVEAATERGRTSVEAETERTAMEAGQRGIQKARSEPTLKKVRPQICGECDISTRDPTPEGPRLQREPAA